MKIENCSASAIKLFDKCNFAYFLRYVLRRSIAAGKAAMQGKIVHKAVEMIAKLHLKGKTIDTERVLEWAWDRCLRESPDVDIRKTTSRGEAADYKKCRNALEGILDSDYNPRKLKILGIEKWFSIEMPGPEWANRNGQQLTVRGFIDLVHEIDENTIEIVDWKTGAVADISSKEIIDSDRVAAEIQAQLYFLAACLIYPEYKNIIITFYYTTDQLPRTVYFDLTDTCRILERLLGFFTTVQKTVCVRRNRTWQCKMCEFNKGDLCTNVWADFCTAGEKFVLEKYQQSNV